MISKDAKCCCLRPDLPLRWSCWSAPLSVLPHVPVCTPASPTPSSQHPVCAPLSPFSPDQLPLSFHHRVLWLSVSLGQESVCFFFSFKQQIVNILDFVCHSISVVTYQLCCCNTKTGKDNTSAKAHDCVPIKLYLQKQVMAILGPQAIVCQLSFQSMQGSRFH